MSSKEELSEKLLAYSLGTIDIEGLHIGSLKSAQIKMDFLLDGREGKEFLKTVIVDRKLSKFRITSYNVCYTKLLRALFGPEKLLDHTI